MQARGLEQRSSFLTYHYGYGLRLVVKTALIASLPTTTRHFQLTDA